MTITGIRISPTAITNAVVSGSLADAEAKLKSVEDALHKASSEWETFVSGSVVKAYNTGKTLSPVELATLTVGVYKLVRGTAAIILAEQAALSAVLQAVKSVNMKP